MNQLYNLAKQQYANIGIDTQNAINVLKNIPTSIHCW